MRPSLRLIFLFAVALLGACASDKPDHEIRCMPYANGDEYCGLVRNADEERDSWGPDSPDLYRFANGSRVEAPFDFNRIYGGGQYFLPDGRRFPFNCKGAKKPPYKTRIEVDCDTPPGKVPLKFDQSVFEGNPEAAAP